MSTTTPKQTSRYSKGGKAEFFPNRQGFWVPKIFKQTENDTIIESLPAKYHTRPDLLASDAYGKASYMWVILQYNSILDITTEFVSGSRIVLPSAQKIIYQFS